MVKCDNTLLHRPDESRRAMKRMCGSSDSSDEADEDDKIGWSL